MAWCRIGVKPLCEPMPVHWRIYAALGGRGWVKQTHIMNGKSFLPPLGRAPSPKHPCFPWVVLQFSPPSPQMALCPSAWATAAPPGTWFYLQSSNSNPKLQKRTNRPLVQQRWCWNGDMQGWFKVNIITLDVLALCVATPSTHHYLPGGMIITVRQCHLDAEDWDVNWLSCFLKQIYFNKNQHRWIVTYRWLSARLQYLNC